MDQEIIELHGRGINGNQISKMLGLPMATVYRKLRKHGLETFKKQVRKNPDLKEKVIAAYQAGRSTPDIARELKCAPSTVSRLLKSEGVEARPLSPYEIDENYFGEIDREDKAYTLGFFTADGCLVKGQAMTIKVTDLDVILKIKAAMGHTAPYRTIPGNGNRKPLYTLEVGRQQLAKDLTRLGCGRAKTFTTSFPNIPPDMHRHFIRGLIDGDGSFSKDRLRIAGTASLLGPILQILRDQTGAGGGVYPSERIFVLDLTGRFQVRRVLDWIYEGATIFMQRKYENYRRIVEES